MKDSKIKLGLGRFAMMVFAITALIYAIMYALDQYAFPGRFTNAFWGAPVFFCVMSILVYFVAIQAFKVGATYFNSIIFSSMGIRVLLCLIYILASNWKEDEMLFFIAFFFILYLLYTLFEIYCLIANLRPDFKKKGVSDE